MKTKLTIFVMIFISSLHAQVDNDYIYFKGTIDPNNLFVIIDNPRTEEESLGLDFDIEAGARFKNDSFYLYYGAFQEIDYQNFGIGYDKHFDILDSKIIETSIGANIGVIMRRSDAYPDDSVWGGVIAPAIRAITTIWIIDCIGVTLTSQLQNRPDIGKTAIFEGNVGVIIRKRN